MEGEQAEVAEPVEEPSQVEPTVEQATPPKRGRGRPPGAKNRVKVRIEPIASEPVAAPPVLVATPVHAAPAEAPKPKKAKVTPIQMRSGNAPSMEDMHRTIMQYAAENVRRKAVEQKASRASHFEALVANMVR